MLDGLKGERGGISSRLLLSFHSAEGMAVVKGRGMFSWSGQWEGKAGFSLQKSAQTLSLPGQPYLLKKAPWPSKQHQELEVTVPNTSLWDCF